VRRPVTPSLIVAGRWGPTRLGLHYETARCKTCNRLLDYVVGTGWVHRDDGTPYTMHRKTRPMFPPEEEGPWRR